MHQTAIGNDKEFYEDLSSFCQENFLVYFDKTLLFLIKS